MINIFKGKYNNKQIVGFYVKIRIRFDWWFWFPKYLKFNQSLTWLIFQIKIMAEYK